MFQRAVHGFWNFEEEKFRMETSPKNSVECMDQGGAIHHLNMGNHVSKNGCSSSGSVWWS